MFDVEDRYSFDEIHGWYETTLKHIPEWENYIWAVIGNKSDLPSEVEQNKITDLCKQIGTELMFFTSAKTGENVKETFETVIREVHKKSPAKSTDGRQSGLSFRLTAQSMEDRSSEKRRCCK